MAVGKGSGNEHEVVGEGSVGRPQQHLHHNTSSLACACDVSLLCTSGLLISHMTHVYV